MSAAIRHNTFLGYDTGFRLQAGNAPTIQWNNLLGQPNSNAIMSENTSVSVTVNAENNYWGTTNPTDIANMIWDQTDDFNNKTLVDYSNYLTQPDPNAPGFLYDLALSPASPIGIQQTTFTLTFSRAMDPSAAPTVTFGTTSPYISFAVIDNARWISDTVWQATYDITSLVPRGVYTISVSSASGLDGMPIPTNTRFSFTVDYAGSITDQTPPPAPQVTACSAANVNTLSARWNAYDPQSAITLYRYAVGGTPGSSEVINWTTTTVTSTTRSGLNLLDGQTYYFAVQARNAGGLWSPIGTSSGIVAGAGGCPTAGFNATPTSGPAPLTVHFTDISSGTINSRLWSFGDGVTSTLLNPLHVYTATGAYTVSLQVSGPGGGDILVRAGCTIVTPAVPPVASFSASPTNGIRPLTVVFTDTSTGTIANWLWSFGDGAFVSTQHPTHTYSTSGAFTVSLQVSGAGGTDVLTRTQFITVHEPASANFIAAPTSGYRPLTVTFTNQSTGDYASSLWNFGDGMTSTQTGPSHIYTSTGVYTVGLGVSGVGGTSLLTRTSLITVTDAPPVAAFSASPLAGHPPLVVTFADQSSGIITDWLWQFGDALTSTLPGPTHTYYLTGTFGVTLTATGPGGTDAITKASYIIMANEVKVYLPLVRR